MKNLHDPCIKIQVLVQMEYGSSMLTTTCCGCRQSIGHHVCLLAGSQLPWVLGLGEYGVAGSILNTCSAYMFVATMSEEWFSSLYYISLLSLFHIGDEDAQVYICFGLPHRNCENPQEHGCRSMMLSIRISRCRPRWPALYVKDPWRATLKVMGER